MLRRTLDLAVAREYSIYQDEKAVEAVGDVGLLQMYWFAEDERTHVAEFLRHWDPPQGSHVLDCGCGTGRFATLLHAERPDLRVRLLNTSLAQLRQCDARFPRVAGDMHHLPYADATVDAVLYAYVLGYAHIACMLEEGARVLTHGGKLIIYDILAERGHADECLVTLGYACASWESLTTDAEAVGLALHGVSSVPRRCLHTAFARGFPPTVVEAITEHIAPWMLVFKKPEVAHGQ